MCLEGCRNVTCMYIQQGTDKDVFTGEGGGEGRRKESFIVLEKGGYKSYFR